jgi:cbb3-type cytochrome c oxidase subunit III
MQQLRIVALFALTLIWVLIWAALGPAPNGWAESELANPLGFDVQTIKRGKQLFTVHCVRCHGVDGRGDTEMREFLKTAPADLSDDQWIYGDSDGAVFTIIKRGNEERDMPGFESDLVDERIWQVVSYIRYLGGERP